MNPDGFQPMAKFNKDTCILILKAMLLDERPTIHYIHQDERAGEQTKHTYRFFILNNTGHYNVSGLITAAFGVNVNDRSQTFSVNTLSHEQDVAAFKRQLDRLLGIENLFMEDLILSAKDILEFGFSPDAFQFLPMAPMPQAEFASDENSEPIPLAVPQ